MILDLVIIGFLGANDFKDNLLGVFKLENGQLVHLPSEYSFIRRMQTIVYYFPFYRWLAAHSHLANLVRKQATVLDDKSREAAHIRTNVVGGMGAENERLTVDITWKFLTEFVRQAKQEGTKLILVNLPTKGQKPFAPHGQNETHVLLYDRLERDFNEIPELEILDLTPFFSKLPVEPYYFPHDGHMTPLGLRLVALEIRDYLKPRLVEKFKSTSRGSDDSAPGSPDGQKVGPWRQDSSPQPPRFMEL